MANNEINHYGVLGMKWGLHRAKTAGDLVKIADKIRAKNADLTGKISKRESKYAETQSKKQKAQSKLIDKQNSAFSSRLSEKSVKQLSKAASKLNKYSKQSVKHLKKIDKYKKKIIKYNLIMDTLNTRLKDLSPASIEKGKQLLNVKSAKEVKK